MAEGFTRSLDAVGEAVLSGFQKGLAVLATLAMISASPALLMAQGSSELAPGAPSWCRACTPPPPFVPPVDPPVDPDPPGDGENPDPPSGRRGWAAIGAAGLALAAGIPLGAALQPTMPFRPVIAEATPATPADAAPGVTPSAAEGVIGPEPNLDRSTNPVTPADAAPGITQQEAPGVLAPATASHLPLLLAIGIAAIAGGVALLRDQRRRRRRSRR